MKTPDDVIKDCIASCIDIYKDFDSNEIDKQPASILVAWANGREAYYTATGKDKCIHDK